MFPGALNPPAAHYLLKISAQSRNQTPVNILGISAFYHDSAACLVRDGEVLAAAQEERFTRKKHDSRFPKHAIDYCLAQVGIGPAQLDFVAFYDKPLAKFDRLLETYIGYAPVGFTSFRLALPVWLREKLHLPRQMDEGLDGEFSGRYSLRIITNHTLPALSFPRHFPKRPFSLSMASASGPLPHMGLAGATASS